MKSEQNVTCFFALIQQWLHSLLLEKYYDTSILFGSLPFKKAIVKNKHCLPPSPTRRTQYYLKGLYFYIYMVIFQFLQLTTLQSPSWTVQSSVPNFSCPQRCFDAFLSSGNKARQGGHHQNTRHKSARLLSLQSSHDTKGHFQDTASTLVGGFITDFRRREIQILNIYRCKEIHKPRFLLFVRKILGSQCDNVRVDTFFGKCNNVI